MNWRETNPAVWQKRSIPAPSVKSSSPHTQAFYDIRRKSIAWKLREASKCYKDNCEFSCCFMWQLRNPLTQEHDMKMSTEWKEFKSEAGSLVLYQSIIVRSYLQ